MAYAMRHRGQITAASGLDVVAGFWLLISPFALMFPRDTDAMINNVVLGLAIGSLALYRFFHPARSAWLSVMNVILGIWVMIAPFVLGFDTLESAKTSNVITGISVILLSAWSAMATADIHADEMKP
jgi:hypothetical protein